MSDFQVDVGKLQHLSRLLEVGMGTVKTALDELKDVGPIRLGHKSLDKACLHVQEEWHSLVGKLEEAGRNAQQAVCDTSQKYDNSEAAIRRELADAAARAAAGSQLPPGTVITPLGTPAPPGGDAAPGQITQVLG